MSGENVQTAVVDSLPSAMTCWKLEDNWRSAADMFISHLVGQGFAVVPIHVVTTAALAIEAWSEQWDCSRTPGHPGMNKAMNDLDLALDEATR